MRGGGGVKGTSDRGHQAEGGAEVLTVSALTARIKGVLESGFPRVHVVGEISRCTRAASGHVYLTLKDESAVLNAVIWRGVATALRFQPEEGVEVIARGSIDVYAPRGSYQLIISWLEPRGVGALQIAFEKLKARLEKEGLFRREVKKPLPRFPRRIGVVTSPTGAAVRDVINVISRRYPAAELLLAPVRVQGEHAAGEIAGALDRLNEHRPGLDVIIVGRGGGSLEDLWAFNEEVVARAIFRSRIPVVSAVGHEVDFSISDFVADVRAATPTEAAEIVVPDRDELLKRLRDRRRRLGRALERMAREGRRRLAAVRARYVFRRPTTLLEQRAQRLDDVLDKMRTALAHRVGLLGEGLAGLGGRLDSLSPLKVLGRGYSLTFGADGRLLRSVETVAAGHVITTRLHRGQIDSRVLDARDGNAPALEDIDAE